MMFLCYVVVGKGIILTQDNQSLVDPPDGYDSVLGDPGGSLNYDEVVVYDQDAVLPGYAIFYNYR